jgi:hypothetical protein
MKSERKKRKEKKKKKERERKPTYVDLKKMKKKTFSVFPTSTSLRLLDARTTSSRIAIKPSNR